MEKVVHSSPGRSETVSGTQGIAGTLGPGTYRRNSMHTASDQLPKSEQATVERGKHEVDLNAQNPILLRAMERIRERREQGVHAGHNTKHSSHSSHSKGSW